MSIDKYKSKRRGKLSTDAESIERREWYESLQRHILLPSEDKESIGSSSSDKKMTMMVASKSVIGEVKSINNNKIIYKDNQLEKMRTSMIKANNWIRQLNTPKDYTATVLCFHGIG